MGVKAHSATGKYKVFGSIEIWENEIKDVRSWLTSQLSGRSLNLTDVRTQIGEHECL